MLRPKGPKIPGRGAHDEDEAPVCGAEITLPRAEQSGGGADESGGLLISEAEWVYSGHGDEAPSSPVHALSNAAGAESINTDPISGQHVISTQFLRAQSWDRAPLGDIA